MAKLSPKQQRFVDEYCLGKSATDAARLAGYSPRRPDVAAAKLLKQPAIAAAIAAIRKAAAEKTGVDVQWILERLAKVAERCMQAEPVFDRKGNRTGEFVFDSAGANRALELLGKHQGMFADRLKLDGPPGSHVQAVFNVRIGS